MLRIQQIIETARPMSAERWQLDLVDAAMSAADRYAESHNADLGRGFAAAFDLIVAAHYYGNVANRGWLYCGPREPMILYPYTNTCPRCALKNKFYFHKANKPRSGSIGAVTSSYLCLCFKWFFKHSQNPQVEIYFGHEPVDVIFMDRQQKSCLLAEIKASPLVTFPLASQSERLTEESDAGRRATDAHQEVTIAQMANAELNMLLPHGSGDYRLVKLGKRSDEGDSTWAARKIASLCQTESFFGPYFIAWSEAFKKYAGEATQDGSYWLTNSCGAPSPMPSHWPRRSYASGYETISDNKTSVGMDRTDDIKKGTYQVLKIGSIAKFPKPVGWHVSIGLVSNIHAVQHYSDYLASISDVMWTKTGNRVYDSVSELPSETSLTNLFDGIISFTSYQLRDGWLENIFSLKSSR